MHTRIEDYSKLTPEELTEDLKGWLGALSLLSQDLVRLRPAKYSEVSGTNPLANGVFLPIGRAAYGIPSVFRLNIQPAEGSSFAHFRRLNGETIDVGALALADPKDYNFDAHGPTSYDHDHPFKDGVYIDVKPSNGPRGGLEAQVRTPSSSTHPVAGPTNDVEDAIHIPLRELEQVTFQAVKLTGSMFEQRVRL